VRLVAAAAAAAAGPAGTGAGRRSLSRVRLGLGLGLVAVALHASSVVIFGFGVVSARLRHRRLRGDVVADANLGRGRPQGRALTQEVRLDVRRSRHAGCARFEASDRARPDRHEKTRKREDKHE
jgi:hypothetical protein